MQLTVRDFDLLRFLGAQGVATADQLAERYFPSRKVCLNRLHVLRRGNLVESLPLSTLREISVPCFRQAVDLLALRSEEVWKHRVYRLTPALRSRTSGADAMADVKMWKHQIQLNGVRRLLEGLFRGATILTDPEIRAEWRWLRAGVDMPVADLVIRQGNHEIAVEVERTQKSEAEYFSRFFKYESSTFTHVLYFCETDAIFNKVSELAKRVRKIGVSRILAPELVYRKEDGFLSLDAFLGRSTPASL